MTAESRKKGLLAVVKTKVGTSTRESGFTRNEKEIAARKLSQLRESQAGNLVVVTENVWCGSGILTRTRKGVVSYLRQSAVAHFLDNVVEGATITYKTVAYATNYGSADFYLIRDWLATHGLSRKVVGGFVIDSVQACKDLWNKIVLSQMLFV